MRWMITLGWVLVIALLAWLFTDTSGKVQVRVNEQGEREVLITKSADNHYRITGEINNIPVDMLVDTGATIIAIPGDLAQTLNLEAGVPIQVMTANGPTTAYMTRIENLRLGDIELRGVMASINPQMRGIDILLGMSALGQLQFEQNSEGLILRVSEDNL